MSKKARIFLISISRHQSNSITSLTNEYTKRCAGLLQEIVIRPPTRNKSLTVVEIKKQELKLIKKVLKAQKINQFILFDENGSRFNSQQFSKIIFDLQTKDRIALIIGGADGFSDEIKKSAVELISISTLTISHELARVVACEQIYRALTIKSGHPYHRE